MTYTEKSLVLEKIRTIPAIYWRVSNNETDKQFLDEQNDLISPEDSAELLENTLNNVTGTVFIQISTRNARTIADSRDFKSDIWKFNVRCAKQPAYKQPNVNPGNISLERFLDVYNQLHSERMKVYQLEMKIDTLENAKNSTLETLLNPIAEGFRTNPQATINGIKGLFQNKSTSISKPNESYSTWSESEKITSILERWKQQDPNYIELLEDFITASEKNPEIIPYVKTAIKDFL